jgi:hypothetical protein
MSAAAQITDTRTVVPDLHAVEATGPSVAEVHDKEMYRWMTWFGAPVLVMAVFMAIALEGGGIWAIGGVLAALITDICVLIWLCMSSDTNGAGTIQLAGGH